jgi:hypothetical protein
VVGWSMAEHMRANLIGDALSMAAGNIEIADGCVFHSDYAEVSVKPRNGGFACAGGGRWLIPRLNEPLVVAA